MVWLTINSPSINGNHIKLGPIQFRLCRIGRRARGERKEGGRRRESSLYNQPWLSCSTIASIAVLWFIYCYGRIRYAFPWPPLQPPQSGSHALCSFSPIVAQMWSILSLIFLPMSCASNATATATTATLRQPNDRSSSSTFTLTATKQFHQLSSSCHASTASIWYSTDGLTANVH